MTQPSLLAKNEKNIHFTKKKSLVGLTPRCSKIAHFLRKTSNKQKTQKKFSKSRLSVFHLAKKPTWSFGPKAILTSQN